MDVLFCAYARQGSGDGVSKKIKSQIRALKKLGHNVAWFSLEGAVLYLVRGKEKQPLLQGVKPGALGEYMALENALRKVANEKIFPAQLCYIRHIFCTPVHLRTLQILKQSGMRLVEELPTYPYDKEAKSFKSVVYRAAAFVDRRCRGGYKKYLDYFVTFSEDTEIFGVPAIPIENGVDVDAVPYVQHSFPRGKEPVRLVAVSAMAPWHGYERLIEGLYRYQQEKAQQERAVEVHLVGEGACKEAWEKLAHKYGLEQSVVFHGFKIGSELDAVFAEADIGVSALGWYKRDFTYGSELKNREYMARGVPFVYSSNERLFGPEDGFCMQAPNSEMPVDIKAVLAFYDDLAGQKNVSRRLRWFAEKYFRWENWMDVVMKTVFPQEG